MILLIYPKRSSSVTPPVIGSRSSLRTQGHGGASCPDVWCRPNASPLGDTEKVFFTREHEMSMGVLHIGYCKHRPITVAYKSLNRLHHWVPTMSAFYKGENRASVQVAQFESFWNNLDSCALKCNYPFSISSWNLKNVDHAMSHLGIHLMRSIVGKVDWNALLE